MSVVLGPFSIDRMFAAAARVRDRLLRSTAPMDAAGVVQAVMGESAIGLRIGEVDESAVRGTPDVDLLIRGIDDERARCALGMAGFVEKSPQGCGVFLDGPSGKLRDAVRVHHAGSPIGPEGIASYPDPREAETIGPLRVLSLPGSVHIHLSAYRTKDRVQLRDLIDVGLIDAGWTERFAEPLASRLHALLDTPGG